MMRRFMDSVGLVCGILLLQGAASVEAAQKEQTSAELWAEYVKNPDAHPNIPNCSYAGYHRGEGPLPEPRVVVNVKECGATGDGKTDETAAFAAAIKKAAATGGAVLVPAGMYIFNGMIRLSHDNVILRGEAPERTILRFQKPLEDLLGPFKSAASSAYSWSGGLVWIGPEDYVGPDGKMKFGSELWAGGARLAEVSAPAKRGDTVVQVAEAGDLKAGETVLLTWQNPADKSLLLHMAGPDCMKSYPWDTQGASLLRERKWKWPVEIAAVDGRHVTLKQPLRIDIRPEWKVGFEPLGPHVREIGIEKLTIQLPRSARDLKSYTSHLRDRGANGIYLNRALHCFVRNVVITDPENGLIHAAAKNTTVTGLVVKGVTAHHATALRVQSHDNLIEKFRIETNPMHGINTEGLSTGNVWHAGEMLHGTFDSHCAMSFESLRTNIVLNSDGRPGGGDTSGPFLGARMVHWGIRMTGGSAEWVNCPEALPLGALVGIKGAPRVTGGKNLWHMLPGEKGCVIADENKIPNPPDLYEAQLKLRTGR